jgi:hypothetical protein
MNTLVKPPQQETLKDISVLRNAEEITRLRTQLGLPATASPRKLAQSRAMLEVLRDMAAHNTPAAASPMQAAPGNRPSDTVTLKATLPEFYSMDSKTRSQFASDGGALAKSDFDKLTLASKSAFCVAGGKILDDSPVTSRNLSTAARSFGNS